MSSLLLSAALGWVAGMRSATAPAVLSSALAARPRRTDRFPATALASPTAARGLGLAAAGELVADKTPWIPDRTDAAPLAGRVASGALVGAAVAGRRGTNRLAAAVAGGLGAAASTYAMHGARREASGVLGDVPAALVEDALALGLGTALARAAVDG